MINDTERKDFEEWLEREMPAGTVIGDPKWWAPRILKAALDQREGWIKCDDRMPDCIPGKDESEVVFGVVGGKVGVYQRQWSGDGWAWCRATGYHYGDLAKTECEFDDDYDVTHWQPMLAPPTGE